MDNKQLDIKAVELSLAKCMTESVIGIFGDRDEAAMIHKMHAMIDFADNLHIKDLVVRISLNSLRAAKIEFEKDETIEKHDD
tara:strand:- start:23840 stop:24085 length:246 start_codon:yes stop_codon:yes gene_type:complete